MLTDSKDECFTVTEIEVWKVIGDSSQAAHGQKQLRPKVFGVQEVPERK